MEKYLISIDLDDTLLTKKKKIPLLTRLGIRRLFHNGHHVILNSGRPYSGMLEYVKKLKLYNYPIIASNGGAIYYINKKLDLVKTISFGSDKEILKSLFNEIKQYLHFASIMETSKQYYYNISNVPKWMFHHFEKFIEVETEDFTFENDIILSSFSIKTKDLDKVKKIFEKKKYKNLILHSWGSENDYSYFDIQNISTNKGTTMLYLAKKLRIKEKNIIAFGDELNDVEMLKIIKNGYLMPRGERLAVQHSLPLIDQDSDHNGVIKFLFKNFKHLF